MSIRATRAKRLLVAVALACLGLAMTAQAALATHGRIQVAKVNQGGNPSDTFAFHATFTWQGREAPGLGSRDFSLQAGGISEYFDVACNINRVNHGGECTKEYSNVTLRVTEQPTPGYTLTDITCRYTQGAEDDVNNKYGAQPTTSSPVKPATEVTTNLAAGTVDLQIHYNEWVVCWFTNTYTGAATPPGGSQPGGSQPPAQQPTTQPTTQPTSQPQIQVQPSRVRPGSAKLRGPSGCPTTNAIAATVTGKRIVKVTFYLDNKKVKTLTKPNKGGAWVLSINMRQIAYGGHRVRARVEFAKSSGTPAKTLRLTFNRCHGTNVRPQFTG